MQDLTYYLSYWSTYMIEILLSWIYGQVNAVSQNNHCSPLIYLPSTLDSPQWLYIMKIYLAYHKDIIIKKGTEQTHEVWSGYIPGILVTWAYAWNMPCIWTVYTMHMLKRLRYTTYIPWLFMIIYGIYCVVYISCIYNVYTMYMPSINLAYTWYIHMICFEYTMYIYGIYIVYT